MAHTGNLFDRHWYDHREVQYQKGIDDIMEESFKNEYGEGEYENDRKHGYGIYTWNDGKQYEGWW